MPRGEAASQVEPTQPTCRFPKTDWRGAVNTNRWLSLSSETSLLAAALEKYDPISALALPLRQTCDVCSGDIRAFWAGKSPFRAERNRETENGRLAGGEDWIRTQSDFFSIHPFQPYPFQSQDTSSEGDAQTRGHGRSIGSLVEVQAR
jgi:hypothetical protein